MDPAPPVEPAPQAETAPVDLPLAIPVDSTPAAPPYPPAMAQLDDADAKWASGDRLTAVRIWRALLAGTETEGTDGLPADALTVMLRVRLLPISGNLGPLWLEGPLDAAVARCDRVLSGPAGPGADWCRIAQADYDLWMPGIAGAHPAQVQKDLTPLAGWAPADTRIAAAKAHLHSAKGAASPNPWPGTWVLGYGISIVPGSGVGFGLHFVDPDLGFEGHRLSLDGDVDSLGGFEVAGSFIQRASTRSLIGRALGGNLRGDVWGAGRGPDAAETSYNWQTAQAASGIASTHGPLVVEGGGEVRWDRAEVVAPMPALDRDGGLAGGPWAAVTWSGPARVSVAGDVDGMAGAPLFAMGSVDVRKNLPIAATGGRVVGRLLEETSTDGPFYRLPSAGGSNLLRGAPAGRWRGPLLAAAQLEYRQHLFGALQGALFVDSAYVGGLPGAGWAPSLSDAHVSVGGGVRLVLPPSDLNVTRIDVGFVPNPDGTVSAGIVVGWGQAF